MPLFRYLFQITSLGTAKQSLSTAQKYLGLAKGNVELGLQPDNEGMVLPQIQYFIL
jgi:hypothetical protein